MANNWTREQTIIALSVYCKIPFNKASNTNPEIVAAANLIGRSPVAVKMKVGNFGSFDPELKASGIVGLSNVSKLDKEIWEEYSQDWERLAYDSEKIKSELTNKSIEENNGINYAMLPEGKDRETIVRQRVNQYFFRSAVLSSYNNRCCITGLSCVELLEACHIAGWTKDIKNRLNPSNGICLNILFHKAYDKFLLGITPDYKVVISERLQEECCNTSLSSFVNQFNNTIIHLPNRFMPNKDMLAQHYGYFKKCNGDG